MLKSFSVVIFTRQPYYFAYSMYLRPAFILIATSFSFLNIHAQHRDPDEKYRVIIMTDMTHDDGNSLIRYLYYSHYFDTEAIVVTQQLPDYNFNDEGPWNKVNNVLNAYQKEYSQLRRHHPDFPEYETLRNVVLYNSYGLLEREYSEYAIEKLTTVAKHTGFLAQCSTESYCTLSNLVGKSIITGISKYFVSHFKIIFWSHHVERMAI
jgi:hypothetical protein